MQRFFLGKGRSEKRQALLPQHNGFARLFGLESKSSTGRNRVTNQRNIYEGMPESKSSPLDWGAA
jgi:hypothetical protein